jgi:hypothetical protein
MKHAVLSASTFLVTVDSVRLIFQQGLIKKSTTKLVLEQEAELIVARHINSLYACGGDFIWVFLGNCECFHF